MEPKYNKTLYVTPDVRFYQVDDGPWYFDSDEMEGQELFGPYPSLEDATAAFAKWSQEPI
jgi:hypothetical protein